MKKVWHYSLLFLVCSSPLAFAAPLNLSQTPLFISAAVPPLNLLVLSKDHKLYYEAYNDASDLDDDGLLDVGYKPAQTFNYYGYFDSKKCYSYSGGQFNPVSITATKKCPGSWSGDFLNYLTTSRMDALRKVLYGGTRSTDTTSATVLERTFIPQDAHSWGKEYESVARDGYNINDYTPLALPLAGRRHFFANTTPLSTTLPLLRVLQNRNERFWQWLSKERPVAGTDILGNTGTILTVAPTDYTVRVKVCDVSVGLEDNCRSYGNPATYKPIGLLQEYGENDKMLFGLLSGSYVNNLAGGVLRKTISSMTNEVNLSTGQFTATVGIVRTIDRLRVDGFGGNYEYSCGWVTGGPIVNGQCNMWGNPVAEMMFEGLRYFAGKGAPTTAYNYAAGVDVSLGLPKATWDNPFASRDWCAKPFMTVVSDINPSYDSDQLPGSTFGSLTSDIALNVSTLAQSIWNSPLEMNGASSSIFIGQTSPAQTLDGAPTPKTVSSFGNIRGLSPEEPTKQGSYYAASIAYYGRVNDINPKINDQRLNTFTVALASPLPRFEIPVNGKRVTIIPFAKSVGGGGVNPATFAPTNQIVDFYVDTIKNTDPSNMDLSTNGGRPYYKFRINFEDVEQGADHDMDAIAEYEFAVDAAGTITVTVNSVYAAGGIAQHMGYVIAGTTSDNTYLVVRDCDTANGSGTGQCVGNSPSSDPNYTLDTPNIAAALPLSNTRTFTPGVGGATFLKDPLWYAAKWGGFLDDDDPSIPAQAANLNVLDNAAEWDNDSNGDPDNYFLVTNPTKLQDQMRKAFEDIFKRTGAAAAVATNSTSTGSTTLVYQASFDSNDWSGKLAAFALADVGNPLAVPAWDAKQLLQTAPAGRQIITYKPTSKQGAPFLFGSLDAVQASALNTSPAGAVDSNGGSRLAYIRGDASNEGTAPGQFRPRPKSVLGDIINSSPAYVGPPNAAHIDPSYVTFRSNAPVVARAPMIYVGANDGMLHAFDALTGNEKLAFVPSKVYKNLTQLTAQNYSHRYFVDGSPNIQDAKVGANWKSVLVSGLGAGGQGVFALDVTDPTQFSQANASSLALWEFTDKDDPDLGYTFGQPLIKKMNNGKWAAIFGNGYNSAENDGSVGSDRGALFILFIEDGLDGTWSSGDYVKIDTGVAEGGLASPNYMDMNVDGIVDIIYAGDRQGNMWRFDLSSPNPTDWNLATKRKILFTAVSGAGAAQSITTKPEVTFHPTDYATTLVYFGTGKYLEPGDVLSTTSESFYGIWDRNAAAPARASLLQQNMTTINSFGTTANYRVPTNFPIDWTIHKGWVIDFPVTKERAVGTPKLNNGVLLFSSFIPSADVCSFGGSGWLMAVDYRNGGLLAKPPFENTIGGVATLISAGGVETGGAVGGFTVIPDPPMPGARGRSTIVQCKTDGTCAKLKIEAAAIPRISWKEVVR